MRVLICGSRNWKYGGDIEALIKSFPDNTTVIVGGANGADSMAEYFAKQKGLNVEVYPANWEKYGKSAGYKRNIQMLKSGVPSVVHAFIMDKNNSKGTLHMCDVSEKEGIKVVKHFPKTTDIYICKSMQEKYDTTY